MPANNPEIREQDVRNPGVAYEHSEADLRVVISFLVALTLSAAMILLVLWGMYSYFRRSSAAYAPAPFEFSRQPKVPPPQLQPDPVADYNVYRLSEQQMLDSYGWVDQSGGVVRIPIDRAMDLLVQRGLPWQAPGSPAAGSTTGTSGGSATNTTGGQGAATKKQ
jgi:hypothetical protein